MISAEFWKSIMKTGQNKLKSAVSFFQLKWVFKILFARVSAIKKKRKQLRDDSSIKTSKIFQTASHLVVVPLVFFRILSSVRGLHKLACWVYDPSFPWVRY